MTFIRAFNPFHAHPAGLKLLFMVEMWERFSYYGMRALLILYLTSETLGENPGRGFSESAASSLYGWYTGLAYLFPLFGGLLADKYLGTHRSLIIGGITISLGHILLGISGLGELARNDIGLSLFCSGLLLVACGTGHFKPCVSVMVGELYPPNDPRRESAFTLYYLGINLGAFLCVFVCGTLGEVYGWHYGFGAAALGMIGGLLHYLSKKTSLLPGIGEPSTPSALSLGVLGSIEVIAALVLGSALVALLPSLHEEIFSFLYSPYLAISAALAVVFFITRWLARFSPRERNAVISILILIFFNTIFWFAFEQAGSSLTLFARDDTDRMIAGSEIPASWFQAINPFLIILLAPVFAHVWLRLETKKKDLTQPAKASLGLLLLSIGFLCTVAATFKGEHEKAPAYWLLFTYAFHTVGELFISPTGLNYVSSKAPRHAVSFLMGCWFLSSFLANLLGGLFAGTMEHFERGEVAVPWQGIIALQGAGDFFFAFFILAAAGGILLALLVPWLRNRAAT